MSCQTPQNLIRVIRLESTMASMVREVFTAYESVTINKISSHCIPYDAEYLFGSAKSGKARTNGDTSSKCEVITGQVAALLEKNPGYRLYVTGHSLGAALAVLYAAHAATSGDPRILKPVSVICIACPKIGNRDFRRAFKVRESGSASYRFTECHRFSNTSFLYDSTT